MQLLYILEYTQLIYGLEAGSHFRLYPKSVQEFPLWLSRIRTQSFLYEDVGLIPGLTQWVKDPGLP